MRNKAPASQVLEGLADHWAEELIEQACKIAQLRPDRELHVADISLAAGKLSATWCLSIAGHPI